MSDVDRSAAISQARAATVVCVHEPVLLDQFLTAFHGSIREGIAGLLSTILLILKEMKRTPPPPVQTPGFLSGVFLFPCKVYGITGPHRGREAVKPTGNGLYRRPHRRKATISLTRKHRNENRQLAVSISNTEKGLLDFLLLTVGAGNITGKRTVRPRHTPGFTCTPCNRQALNLPTQISIPAHRQERIYGPHTPRLPPPHPAQR